MCQALVNIVRVREGAALLQRRLDDNLLSGFQDGVKLLVSDTNLSDNVKVRERAREEEREGERAHEGEREGEREIQFVFGHYSFICDMKYKCDMIFFSHDSFICDIS